MKVLVLLTALLVTGCGPIPGGSLSGTMTDVPDSWQEILSDNQICEIESRLEDPHSIQVECFLYEDDVYVQSHRYVDASWWPTESWALIWQQHPGITVRFEESLFLMDAVRITDLELRETVLKLRGYDPVPDGIVLFRFDKAKNPESRANRS
ncbi:MAG: hypothetical protein VB957_16800 [Pseudomonadales bacterium]